MDSKIKKLNRLSKKGYSDYYLEVSYGLVDLKLDDNTICAAMLYGSTKGGVSVDTIKRKFAEDISIMVGRIINLNAVKKNISILKYETESLRKLLLTTSKDVRILFIKLCDKCANMRDIKYVEEEYRKKICREVLDIYSPLAYRIGLSKIKSELEDLAFKELEPGIYKKIQDIVEYNKIEREKIIYYIKKFIDKKLEEANIKAEIYGRAKHIYSIYRKTIIRNYKLEDIMDLTALRIVVDNIEDCYLVLKVVHGVFTPIPGRLIDYIASPKSNGYQSLHTNVINNNGKIIEFQIRTHKMHENAERGIASHFSYKGVKHNDEFDKKLDWLKQL